MQPRLTELLRQAKLSRIEDLLTEMSMPAIGFELERASDACPVAKSKIGGQPDLPEGFEWPHNQGRPLDFVVQINLTEASAYDAKKFLPSKGLLTFFYDLDDQPWGYDPNDLRGFRVVFTPFIDRVKPHVIPNRDYGLAEHSLKFHFMETLPHYGSRAADILLSRSNLNEREQDAYFDIPGQLEGRYYSTEECGNHHLLGHSANIQDDMQLEAQLVTNGLYCGNATGYNDPRRAALESGAEDWLLLLQIDSDEAAGILWGDCGMLYCWIRRDELLNQQFEHVWTTIQCH